LIYLKKNLAVKACQEQTAAFLEASVTKKRKDSLSIDYHKFFDTDGLAK
jgi:hypothetical protein